jgi:uncharacterized membrane protein
MDKLEVFGLVGCVVSAAVSIFSWVAVPMVFVAGYCLLKGQQRRLDASWRRMFNEERPKTDLERLLF